MKEASTSLLEKYGSQLIKSVKYRDSFVMLGQKGLARGKAIEVVRKSNETNHQREKGIDDQTYFLAS